jgi:multiple sugar transport system permease protein
MLLAGLQAIPEELYDAAKIDGAGAWQRFRHVTIPALRSVAAVALILVILWVFRDFPIIMILTGGGPLRATQTLAIMTYQTAFGFFDMGYAASIGVVTLVISIIASIFMIQRISTEFY